MVAYLIADFEILNLEGMREYLERVGATTAQYGGTYLVKGEDEYTAIKAIRHQTVPASSC